MGKHTCSYVDNITWFFLSFIVQSFLFSNIIQKHNALLLISSFRCIINNPRDNFRNFVDELGICNVQISLNHLDNGLNNYLSRGHLVQIIVHEGLIYLWHPQKRGRGHEIGYGRFLERGCFSDPVEDRIYKKQIFLFTV